MPIFDRLHTEPVYNTSAVVQRTGVPADTIRAWERRYGSPAPCRTKGNQRLYSERDLALIVWLRDRTREGMTISQAIALYESLCREKHALADTPHAPAPGDHNAMLAAKLRAVGSEATPFQGASAQPRQLTPMARLSVEVADALGCFDAHRAERVIEELIVFTSIEDICSHILEPALQEIGRRWEHGQVPSTAEHFASAFVMRKVQSLFNLSQPHVGKGPIVAACVEGEMHEIGLLVSALFLSRAGYQIVYLGTNLPAHELALTVRQLHPPIVLLSASSERSVDALKLTVTQIRAAEQGEPADCTCICFGGSIFNASPELRRRVEAEFLGDDPTALVANVERLVNRQPVTSQATG